MKSWLWLALAVCGIAILGSMAGLTHLVLSAEQGRAEADARAALEEKVRLALWRMDAVAAGVVIEENRRAFSGDDPASDEPLVRCRFRMDAAGVITGAGDADAELARLVAESQLGLAGIFQAMERNNQWAANSALPSATGPVQGFPQSSDYQVQLNRSERNVRGKAFNQNLVQANGFEDLGVSSGAYQPLWIGDEPFLLRSAQGGVEGVWLDRGVFQQALLNEADELLPLASLMPMRPDEVAIEPLGLAAFPWRLVVGESPQAAGGVDRSVWLALLAGWLAAGLALVAGVVMVAGIVRLSERRAAFVSAVTHEMRTPLTTFRLYTDMLDSGAVTEESKRSRYFRTLRSEADRLSHLVENVLAFSGIERRAAKPAVEKVDMASWLEAVRPRMEERLATAGMILEIAVEPGQAALGNRAAMEQVLFNLIDNAAKYGANSNSGKVLIRTFSEARMVILEVRDEGRGIPAAERAGVFRPFHKSARAAAESKPGVGLGLALSRRLARAMGGELILADADRGARFLFRLPAAEA
ncbi:MAG: HAMP domain-containing histidine kinase [Akkermansiaceae bacterium]|nr:HAMP domain-containing histidine kinase [Akkermansiaceae bacterium]